MAHRYVLKSYLNGRNCKTDCPICSGKKTFVQYYDTFTAQFIAGAGKCDRVNSCGAHITPSQVLDNTQHFSRLEYKRIMQRQKATAAAQAAPQFYALNGVFSAWRGNYTANKLYCYLSQIFGINETNCAFNKYSVTDDTTGGAVFWQTNGKGAATTGRIIHYKTDGHRNKDYAPYWVHSIAIKEGKLPRDYNPPKYLFGLNTITKGANVLIVESEKSALICYLYNLLKPGNDICGDYTAFCATGGATMISATLNTSTEILRANGVKITLCPDDDPAGDNWRKTANLYGAKIHDIARDNNSAKISGYDIGDLILDRLNQAQTAAAPPMAAPTPRQEPTPPHQEPHQERTPTPAPAPKIQTFAAIPGAAAPTPTAAAHQEPTPAATTHQAQTTPGEEAQTIKKGNDAEWIDTDGAWSCTDYESLTFLF